MSISGTIDESPYGPGTLLQLQREGLEMRTSKIIGQFQRLKMEVYEWERSTMHQPISSVEIHQQFKSLSKIVTELSNQALLARLSIPICRDISSLADVISQIKRNGLKRASSHIEIPLLGSDSSLNSSTHHKMNLSAINPPSIRVQSIHEVIEVQN